MASRDPFDAAADARAMLVAAGDRDLSEQQQLISAVQGVGYALLAIFEQGVDR